MATQPHPQHTLDSYIVDTLLRDLIGHDRRPAAFLVYLWLYTRAAPSGSWSARASHQTIADATGLSRAGVQTALRHLSRRQLIESKRATPTAVPKHTVRRPWASRRPA